MYLCDVGNSACPYYGDANKDIFLGYNDGNGLLDPTKEWVRKDGQYSGEFPCNEADFDPISDPDMTTKSCFVDRN